MSQIMVNVCLRMKQEYWESLKELLRHLEAIQQVRDIIRRAGGDPANYFKIEKSSRQDLEELAIHLNQVLHLNGSRRKLAFELLQSSIQVFMSSIDRIKKAQNLVDWMQAKGITQHELAQRLGVSKATVNKWCTGK